MVATRARGSEIVRTTLFFSFRGVRRGCTTLFFSVVASPAILLCPDADADIATMSVMGGALVRACLCCRWPSRLWLTSESRRPGPVISSGLVRDTNVYSLSCEWWWSELCGRKVVLQVRMPVAVQLCVVVACSVRVAGSLERLGLYGSVAEAGMWLCYRCSRHLYRWSTNGISAIWVSWSYESPPPLCDVL